MTRHYYKSDVLQAVTAALLWGQMGIGRAARDQEGTDLDLDVGLTVCVDQGARDILREAQRLVDQHGIALGMESGQPLTRHDLRAALPDRRTPQERTRDQVYSSGNRWQIENYEATH